MTAMRLTAEFITHIGAMPGWAANNDHIGDEEFVLRNLASAELTHLLRLARRHGGLP